MASMQTSCARVPLPHRATLTLLYCRVQCSAQMCRLPVFTCELPVFTYEFMTGVACLSALRSANTGSLQGAASFKGDMRWRLVQVVVDTSAVVSRIVNGDGNSQLCLSWQAFCLANTTADLVLNVRSRHSEAKP